MEKQYKRYKCENCNKEYVFLKDEIPFDTCKVCHSKLILWEYFNADENSLKDDVETVDDNTRIITLTSYIQQDVHSIKNMILFFTILTVLNLIASFIMLMAR